MIGENVFLHNYKKTCTLVEITMVINITVF